MGPTRHERRVVAGGRVHKHPYRPQFRFVPFPSFVPASKLVDPRSMVIGKVSAARKPQRKRKARLKPEPVAPWLRPGFEWTRPVPLPAAPPLAAGVASPPPVSRQVAPVPVQTLRGCPTFHSG